VSEVPDLTTELRRRVPPKPDRCELCGRVVAALTRHHLIPRTRHRASSDSAYPPSQET